jgi:CubicO group peptidase (beta-lactamase class C family)
LYCQIYNRRTGWRDLATKAPLEEDDMFRLYSMTKPIVSVAILQLVEQGKLLLSDPVWKFLGPKWKKKNLRVLVPGSFKTGTGAFETAACTATITVKMLLTHTSGLSYGFDHKGIMNKVGGHIPPLQ